MDFAQRTVDIARQNVAEGGRPFATVIVRDGQILAESPNRVAQTHEVIFLTTRDAYEPHYVDDRKYFELNTTSSPSPGTDDAFRCATNRATPPSRCTNSGGKETVVTDECKEHPEPSPSER
jgi:hypothetical protein